MTDGAGAQNTRAQAFEMHLARKGAIPKCTSRRLQSAGILKSRLLPRAPRKCGFAEWRSFTVFLFWGACVPRAVFGQKPEDVLLGHTAKRKASPGKHHHPRSRGSVRARCWIALSSWARQTLTSPWHVQSCKWLTRQVAARWIAALAPCATMQCHVVAFGGEAQSSLAEVSRRSCNIISRSVSGPPLHFKETKS